MIGYFLMVSVKVCVCRRDTWTQWPSLMIDLSGGACYGYSLGMARWCLARDRTIRGTEELIPPTVIAIVNSVIELFTQKYRL